MKRTLCCSVMFLIIFLSRGHAEAEEPVSSAALFETKCGTCHNIDRPKSKRKTSSEWRTTVLRMQRTHRAPITDDEASRIIDYLSTHFGVE